MNVMKKAWQIAKEAVVKFGGKAREYLAAALKSAWDAAKGAKSKEIEIVEGVFAAVTSGNCSVSWIVDGDDVQARANKALSDYWGNKSSIVERGVKGFAVNVIGSTYLIEVLLTRGAAEQFVGRVSK